MIEIDVTVLTIITTFSVVSSYWFGKVRGVLATIRLFEAASVDVDRAIAQGRKVLGIDK